MSMRINPYANVPVRNNQSNGRANREGLNKNSAGNQANNRPAFGRPTVASVAGDFNAAARKTGSSLEGCGWGTNDPTPFRAIANLLGKLF